jgi:hypothetical protein
MNTKFRLMIISVLLLVAAPTWADDVRHVYHCVQEAGAHDDALAEIASEWLAAARKLEGGENLQVHVHFPVAADVGDVDFLFVVVAPSFLEMGKFLHAYDGSPLEEIDDRFDQLASCPNSALWDSITID